MTPIFAGNQCVTVSTWGWGRLVVLTYDPVTKALNPNIQAKHTSNNGETRWMLGFSFCFRRFALIWEGDGSAVIRIGNSDDSTPVGRSWESATLLVWGATTVQQADVSSHTKNLKVNDLGIFWIIPDATSFEV
jgi:hypothetical protein